MPRDYRDPKLAKTDPMLTIHVKIPTSVISLLNIAGTRRQRHQSFMTREILEQWAAKFRVELAEESAVASAAAAKKPASARSRVA